MRTLVSVLAAILVTAGVASHAFAMGDTIDQAPNIAAVTTDVASSTIAGDLDIAAQYGWWGYGYPYYGGYSSGFYPYYGYYPYSYYSYYSYYPYSYYPYSYYSYYPYSYYPYYGFYPWW